MDHVTQQNTEYVQQSARAAAALQKRVEHLAQVISVFRLSGIEEKNAHKRGSSSIRGSAVASAVE